MPKQTQDSQPITISDIAMETGEQRHRIEYIIDSRSIQPCRRVGNCNLYPASTLALIRAELARISRPREGGVA